MTRGCVRTCDKDTGRILNFGDGVGHGATSKCCGKTCHCGRMSEPGAVIHIVGPDHCSCKFLNQVILFIGNFCGSQHTDAIRPVGVNDALEFVGRWLDGFVPGAFLQLAIFLIIGDLRRLSLTTCSWRFQPFMHSFPSLTGWVFMGRVSISRPSITWKRTPQPVPQYEHTEGMILKSMLIAPYIIWRFFIEY